MAHLPPRSRPIRHAGERETLLSFLNSQRLSVVSKIEGLDDSAARWQPDGMLISLLGIVNHLAHVEWRWCDGAIKGDFVSRSEDEFTPSAELTVSDAIEHYRNRCAATDAAVRSAESLSQPAHRGDDVDVRWVVLHLIEETARHAGHADATREMLDGTIGL